MVSMTTQAYVATLLMSVALGAAVMALKHSIDIAVSDANHGSSITEESPEANAWLRSQEAIHIFVGETEGVVFMMLPCPTIGCDGRRGSNQVCCRVCWSTVSPPTRRRVWRAYQTEPLGREHLEAVAAAKSEAQDMLDSDGSTA